MRGLPFEHSTGRPQKKTDRRCQVSAARKSSRSLLLSKRLVFLVLDFSWLHGQPPVASKRGQPLSVSPGPPLRRGPEGSSSTKRAHRSRRETEGQRARGRWRQSRARGPVRGVRQSRGAQRGAGARVLPFRVGYAELLFSSCFPPVRDVEEVLEISSVVLPFAKKL